MKNYRGDRDQAVDLLAEVQEHGVSAESILDFILTHSLSGADALFAMRDVKAEFIEDDEDEDEDDREQRELDEIKRIEQDED